MQAGSWAVDVDGGGGGDRKFGPDLLSMLLLPPQLHG